MPPARKLAIFDEDGLRLAVSCASRAAHKSARERKLTDGARRMHVDKFKSRVDYADDVGASSRGDFMSATGHSDWRRAKLEACVPDNLLSLAPQRQWICYTQLSLYRVAVYINN